MSGLPASADDARLYVLCCLAHEQRPQLGKRDVLFLRCLTDAIVDELEQRQTLETDLIRETP